MGVAARPTHAIGIDFVRVGHLANREQESCSAGVPTRAGGIATAMQLPRALPPAQPTQLELISFE